MFTLSLPFVLLVGWHKNKEDLYPTIYLTTFYSGQLLEIDFPNDELLKMDLLVKPIPIRLLFKCKNYF